MQLKSFFVRTNGCMTLRNKTGRAAGFLTANGWRETANISDADTVILTTCGVIEKTEGESHDMIWDALNRARSGASVIVSGCLPKINRDGLVSVFGSKVVIEDDWRDLAKLVPGAIGKIEDAVPISGHTHSTGDPLLKNKDLSDDELLLQGFTAAARRMEKPWIEDVFRYTSRGFHFWQEPEMQEVLIADGCSFKCNFCATVLAIGKLKSRHPDKIAQEVSVAARAGYRKIVLQGDELGLYGHDIGTNLRVLLDALADGPTVPQIGLRYVHPYAVLRHDDWLNKAFASGQLYFMCNAFQTGSPKLAKRMNRSGDLEGAARRIKGIMAEAPGAFFHSQFIVGFPGESEDDFQKTLDFVRDMDFHYINVEMFSARPNTGAADLADDIPPEVKQHRLATLEAAHAERRKDRLESAARQVVEYMRASDPLAWTDSPMDYVRRLGARSMSAPSPVEDFSEVRSVI